MNWMDIPLFAFLALGAENVLFTGGAGLSRAMRAARRPGLTRWYALFVTLFGAAVMELSVLVNPLLELTPAAGLFRPAVFALLCALLYAAAAPCCGASVPPFTEGFRRCCPLRPSTAWCCRCRSIKAAWRQGRWLLWASRWGPGSAFWLPRLFCGSCLPTAAAAACRRRSGDAVDAVGYWAHLPGVFGLSGHIS